jgi:hemerythrin-like domain-containing protein
MCSYCGCRALTEIADLTAQHEAIVNATGPLRKAALAQDQEATNRHVAALVALLNPHTTQEEVGVFAELSKRAEFTEHVKALCAEHEQLHARFARVADGEVGLIDEAISALREHIEKEENGLFPAAAVELEGTLWQELADRSAQLRPR